MPKEWGGHRGDEPQATTNMTIDARRIVLEQLDDASLRALENLERVLLSGPSTSEGDQAGSGSGEGEERP
jgi:hypothetical protein